MGLQTGISRLGTSTSTYSTHYYLTPKRQVILAVLVLIAVATLSISRRSIPLSSTVDAVSQWATTNLKHQQHQLEDSTLSNLQSNSPLDTLTSTNNHLTKQGAAQNATLLILVSPHTDIQLTLLPTLRNIEEKFNNKLKYPIQLLVDGSLPGDDVLRETEIATDGRARWSLITKEQGWGPPSHITQTGIDESIGELGFSLGYRNMCRFYSGFFWDHPAVRGYEYIWRLDTGVRFWCELDFDPIAEMNSLGKKYAYSILSTEGSKWTTNLWETTHEFLNDHPEWREEENMAAAMLEERRKEKEGEWNMRIVYNNFEISHRSIWESPRYLSYFKHLDSQGGIYYDRWGRPSLFLLPDHLKPTFLTTILSLVLLTGDAPIHTLALSYLFPAQIWHDLSRRIGYQHDLVPFFCPKEEAEGVGKCDCEPKGGWSVNGKSRPRPVRVGRPTAHGRAVSA
ncbi:nucleotide-diphospho-sugar transferase [Meredithblackwellia eburnea MCA 4105]